jgi:small-conductance mechanosensitive channel
MSELLSNPTVVYFLPHLKALAYVLGAVFAGLAVHLIAFKLMKRISGRTDTDLDDALVHHMRGPSRIFFPVLLLNFVVPALQLGGGPEGLLRHGMSLALIVAVAWTLIRVTAVITQVVEARYDINAADNLMARQIHTQLRVLRKVVIVLVVVLGGATMLMTFDKVRQLGTSILASAGIVGIVVGMSAQQTLKNLIAGVQIAITQPIRIDDVVIVEGEWGRIEEIGFTFVVVRIWDLRRLVVPISYFIEKPFQNWTRVTADVLGTIHLHLDYSIPLDAVRAELKRIVEAREEWDGKVCGLQVTDCTEQTLNARALISASDASKAWDLRCHVREQLLTFVQKNYPAALPRVRAEVEGPAPAPAAAS